MQDIETEIPCTKCGEPQMVPLSQGTIDRFKATLPRMRPVIQTVFPKLTLDQREMLKTGFCPKCWDKIFDEDPGKGDVPHPDPAKDTDRMDRDDYQNRNPGAGLPGEPDPFEVRKAAVDEARRPHHAQESGHSDGEGYEGEDR